MHLFTFCILFLIVIVAVKGDTEDNETTEEEMEARQGYWNRYRRPLDLNIRVPFFTMFLRRQKTGQSNLGLQVFPDSQHGSLVDIDHRWWGK